MYKRKLICCTFFVGRGVWLYAEKRVGGGNPRNPGKACGGSGKMVLYFMSEALNFEKRKGKRSMETVYIAGGCLWGVQHFF